jgi:hypothetical protein
MRKVLISVFAATLASGAMGHNDPMLVQLSVKDVALDNGQGLEMSFQEVERAAGYSVAEVRHSAGGSVSSSMFVLRGMCGVAHSRGKQYFRAVQLSKTPTRYRITFPPSAAESDPGPAEITDKVFSLPECALLNFW